MVVILLGFVPNVHTILFSDNLKSLCGLFKQRPHESTAKASASSATTATTTAKFSAYGGAKQSSWYADCPAGQCFFQFGIWWWFSVRTAAIFGQTSSTTATAISTAVTTASPTATTATTAGTTATTKGKLSLSPTLV